MGKGEKLEKKVDKLIARNNVLIDTYSANNASSLLKESTVEKLKLFNLFLQKKKISIAECETEEEVSKLKREIDERSFELMKNSENGVMQTTAIVTEPFYELYWKIKDLAKRL